MQKIYHWILEWGDLVVCISSNLDITLFFFKELDKTKYGQISVILLYTALDWLYRPQLLPYTLVIHEERR